MFNTNITNLILRCILSSLTLNFLVFQFLLWKTGMSMMSKVWVWKNISGIAGRFNDVIYMRPVLSPSRDVLVYFGGDVQDIKENMEKHADSKKYIEWSLENTARILSENFPKKHILIVRPSRMHVTKYAVFSCYDNFVPGNEYGVPSFTPKYNSLRHLQELIKSSLEQLETCNAQEETSNCGVNQPILTLMGFSKGCVVLNQLLHEFHYYDEHLENNTEINDFLKSIQSMWWLDGGHGGSKNTWITEDLILKTLAKLNIKVHVHVTPYQVQDSHRPWIQTEEMAFSKMMQSLGVLAERNLHFGDKPRSLVFHFNVLKAVKDCTT